jgi:hypothetical protein
MGYMFLLNLISTAVRRNWLAVSLFILLSALVFAPYATGPWLALARSAVFFTIVVFALIRFGVLTVSAIIFTQLTLLDFPLTINWSVWYAGSSLLAVCMLIGLALYGVVTTLAGRRAWPATLDATCARTFESIRVVYKAAVDSPLPAVKLCWRANAWATSCSSKSNGCSAPASTCPSGFPAPFWAWLTLL